MNRDGAMDAAASSEALAKRARTFGWLTLLFGALGVADAIRFVRAVMRPGPLVVGDWVVLAFTVILLLAAGMYLRERRQLLAFQRAAAASNTGRPST